jgi:hypothetical protein
MSNMIKPILAFRAVVTGSAYPRDFTPDDEFEVDSETAKIALDLGCLSDEDSAAVREALGLGGDQTGAAAEKATGKKDRGKAPENKSDGAND